MDRRRKKGFVNNGRYVLERVGPPYPSYIRGSTSRQPDKRSADKVVGYLDTDNVSAVNVISMFYLLTYFLTYS